MPPIPGMMHWHSLIARHAKSLRAAFNRAARTLEAHASGQQAKLEPILARTTPRKPLHPLARIRQGQNRWYSTARRSFDHVTRQFTTDAFASSSRKHIDRSAFPKSRVSNYISQSSGRAPFASTLRPNLTGGTLGRTAGGYTIGAGRSGARYFSHTPAAQAQVVQNVSQAVRAFFISGHKAQFDGVSSRGETRFKTVTALQEETGRHIRGIPKATPGSWISFDINPTITAFTPLRTVTGFESVASTAFSDHLNTDGLLDVLSVDFSRVLQDLAATMHDLKRLSALGDLPISYEDSSLRIHFPGCDADTVERLCQELAITRGHIHQDPLFDAFAGTEIALLFPFAPSKTPSEDSMDSYFDNERWANDKPPAIDVQSLLTISQSPVDSLVSEPSGSSMEDVMNENPWLSSHSGYESVRSEHPSESDPLEYQGFEGIYRFLEELDSVRRT